MINYDKLFDVIYSETLPESVKCRVLERVEEEIDESELFSLNESELNPMTNFVMSLIESNISEESLYEVLDMTFENVSEEVINEVSDELRKQAAQNVLAKRRSEAGWAEAKERELGPRVNKGGRSIGLSDMRKKWATQDRIKADKRLQHAENVASGGSLGRLKDTAGKIFRGKDKPIGLTGIKGRKSYNTEAPAAPAQSAPTPAQSTTKAEQPSGSTEPKKPGTSLVPVSKVRTNKKPGTSLVPVYNRTSKRQNAPRLTASSVPALTGPVKPSDSQEKRDEARSRLGRRIESEGSAIELSGPTANGTKAKKGVTGKKGTKAKKGATDNNGQLSLFNQKGSSAPQDNSAKKPEENQEVKNNATETTAQENIKKKRMGKNPHASGTRAFYEYIVANSGNARAVKSAQKKLSEIANNDSTTVTNAKKLKQNKKRAKVTNESLSRSLSKLVNSNISESTLCDIMEMISNKEAAEKAVDREYDNFNKKMGVLNKAEETKALNGVDPLTPDQRANVTKEASSAAAKYEAVRRRANKKYNLNK